MAECIDLTAATTEELQAIVREDARHLDQDSDMDFLTPILEELTRRRIQEHPEAMTTEQAFEQFNQHYRPEESETIMDKQKRYDLYAGSVNPGWWPVLDKYLPQILAIDPEAQIEVKEKFGALRIWIGSETVDDHSVFDPIVEAAEEASRTICERCGAPGRPRKRRWIQTLCDHCFEK